MKMVVKPFPQHPWGNIVLREEENKDETRYFKLSKKILKYAQHHQCRHDDTFIYRKSDYHPLVYEVAFKTKSEFIEAVFKDDVLFDSYATNYSEMLSFIDPARQGVSTLAIQSGLVCIQEWGQQYQDSRVYSHRRD